MPQASEGAESSHSHESKNHHRLGPCGRLCHHRSVRRQSTGKTSGLADPNHGTVAGTESNHFHLAASEHCKTGRRRADAGSHHQLDHSLRARHERPGPICPLAAEDVFGSTAVERRCGSVRIGRRNGGLRKAAARSQLLRPVCNGVSGSAGIFPAHFQFRWEPPVLRRHRRLKISNQDRVTSRPLVASTGISSRIVGTSESAAGRRR